MFLTTKNTKITKSMVMFSTLVFLVNLVVQKSSNAKGRSYEVKTKSSLPDLFGQSIERMDTPNKSGYDGEGSKGFSPQRTQSYTEGSISQMNILEFVSANTQLFSVTIAALAGLFAFIKWVDSRNRELKEERYSKYMNLIGVISGVREDGHPAKLTEQIAATWFLIEYKEYYQTTLKIFSNCDFKNMANENWTTHVLPHIREMSREISVIDKVKKTSVNSVSSVVKK